MSARDAVRCCMCRIERTNMKYLIETDLPGTGFRCRDRVDCATRVREIVNAHKALETICQDVG